MKLFINIIFIFILIVSASLKSFSQDNGFGVGILVGEPTGISMKGWLTKKTAFDVGVAWSFIKETSFHIHADYLMHSFNVFETEENIPLYYGIGGRIKIGEHDKSRLGFRMVGGIEYLFRDAPFDLFLEVAPILDLVPKTELTFNGGFGARYFFD